MFNRLVYKTIRFFWKTSAVAGWISFQDAIITQILLSEQEKFGCNGDFLEIGTYEGKYALLCSPYFKGVGQTIYLNDVFDVFIDLST